MGVDVDESRGGAGRNNRRDGWNGRVGYRDDLVAGADADRFESEEEGIGATVDANPVLDADELSELLLERFDPLAQDQPSRSKNVLDSGHDLIVLRLVLR